METLGNNIAEAFGTTLGNLLWALVILVVGWILAAILRAVTVAILKRTTLDDRLAKVYTDAAETKPVDIDRVGGQFVYYTVLLLVVIAFFDQLGLVRVAAPLAAFVELIFGYLPNLLAAGILVLVAWVVATIARFLLRGVFRGLKLDERLAQQTETDVETTPSVGNALAEAVFWLIILIFVPPVLQALGMTGILVPVQNMWDQVLGYLPNILWAIVLFLVGWFVARVARRITVSALAAFGLDKLGEREDVARALGKQTLSGLAGLIVYTLIMLVVLIAALDALEIAAISDPAIAMLEIILAAVPAVVAAVVVLIVAYYVGKFVAELVANLLAGLGFDRVFTWLGLDYEPEEGQRTPSEVVGYLVLLGIMLFAIAGAADLVGFDSLTTYVGVLIAFFTRLVIALIVFAIGVYLANLARNFVRTTGHPQANFLAQLAWVTVVVFTLALALGQSGISQSIVDLAFGLTLGAIAVAAALAFGLGSRDLAGREMERFVDSFREQDDQETE
jgi:small-conductance mechanosensitive channel